MQKYLDFDKLTATVIQGGLEAVPYFDAVVGGMNAFGILDTDYDAEISTLIGTGLQQRVQQRVMEEYQGEQQVGTALLVETGHPRHLYFIHAPVMRVPMRIAHSDHVYSALFAALVAARRHNQHASAPVRVVACPALGMGVGGLPAVQSARQLALAYKYFLNPPGKLDWHMANNRQQEIRYGGDDGFHFPPEWA